MPYRLPTRQAWLSLFTFNSSGYHAKNEYREKSVSVFTRSIIIQNEFYLEL